MTKTPIIVDHSSVFYSFLRNSGFRLKSGFGLKVVSVLKVVLLRVWEALLRVWEALLRVLGSP